MALWKWDTKNGFFSLFFTFITPLEQLQNISCLTLIYITGEISIKIWGHLRSFQFIYRLTYLSSTRPILSSYRIILNMFRVFWVRSGSFRLILAYLGSFRLIWAHLDSLELIKIHLRSFRLIQALLGLFRLIWALLRPFRLIYAHLSLFWLN